MNFWQRLDNPIFVKEMRIGFREKKVFYGLSAWVIVIALIASLTASSALSAGGSVSDLPEAGRVLFEFLFWAQLGFLVIFAPSLTTASVSGERERKSFDMLVTTQLSPAELIFGKFGFAIAFILLALLSTIPFEAVVFVLGGVSLQSFLLTKLSLASLAALTCLIGMTLSARETRSAYATGSTYLALVLLSIFVTPIIASLRYIEDVPAAVTAWVVLFILYCGLFLFWKSVNHLEERARHLKILRGLTLVFYIVLVSVSMLDDSVWQSLSNSLWPLYGPINYLLFGLMLNPMLPKKRLERESFRKSILNSPALWIGILTVGSFVPFLVWTDWEFGAAATYTVFSGLGTALFARGLSADRPSRFPFALGFSWLLLNVLPVFIGLMDLRGDSIENDPLMLSPLAYLIEVVDSGYRYHQTSLPTLALGFYAALGLIGLGLEFVKRRRLKKA